jgi:hypothetical protein
MDLNHPLRPCKRQFYSRAQLENGYAESACFRP